MTGEKLRISQLSSQKNKKNRGEITIEGVDNPIFAKNLKALFQQDELLAARMLGMTNHEKYEIFMGKDPIDINFIDKNSLKYVYENPAKDVENMINDTEKAYKRYPILYFYGLGNGIFYKALLGNEVHKNIIVIEPDIEIIYIVLNFLDLSKELESERLMLFYSEAVTYTQLYFLVAKTEFLPYAKLYDLHIHTPFYDQYAQDIERVNKNFTKAISHVAVSNGNSIDDALWGIKNHIQNLPDMIKNYTYKKLALKRVGLMDTAVVVATGPSLDKQLETLKEYAPYVTIISLDASYPILAKHGIKPDYVTSIERVEATSSFFKEKYGKFDDDIYFIIASLTHKQTIKNIGKRRLALTVRPQQSEFIFDMEEYGYLGIGHSTANQAYQLAYALKHKNIVLIGQDLAFAPDGRSHATGHAFSQSDEYLYTTAYGGEGKVRTTYVWNIFKNRYEKDIEQTIKEGHQTYNCTEGGARIEGAIEQPFKEVMAKLCKDKKVKNLPHVQINSEATIKKDLLKAYKVIQNKLKSEKIVKEKLEKAFLDVVPQIDEILKLRDNDEVTEKLFAKLLKITKKIDKVKDFIDKSRHRKYIEGILNISIYYQELELAKILVAPSETDLEKTNKLIEWVEIHKYWLFSLAGGINADIETTKKASKGLVRELKKRGLISEK